MKSFRVLALSLTAIIFTFFLTACGGGSKKPTPPAPLKITTSVLANGTVNIGYSVFLQASGGTGTYTWGLASNSGPLPPGLTLDPGHGSITGTPTTFGSYTFTPQVTDGAGTTATANLTLTIQGVVLIKCDSCAQGTMNLPPGNPGVPYSASLSASGGETPYTWCVLETSGTCDNGSQGALPPGLTLSTVNNGAVISGTPTTPGTPTPFTLQVTDSEKIPSSGSINLNLTIFDVGPKTLPNATLNTPYNQNIVAIGGLPPFNICIVRATAPAIAVRVARCHRASRWPLPLRSSPTSALARAPTQQGTTTFTVKATDGENPQASATAQTSLTVGPLATNATLNGQYAIIFNGFNNGTPFFMLGSFTFDGNGNVAAGVLDYNDGTGEPNDSNYCSPHSPGCPVPQLVQTGSVYDLNTNGNGLGTMLLKTLDHSGNPHTYNFDISVSGTGCTANRLRSSCGTLIESDGQSYGSGLIKVQNARTCR